MNIFSTSTFFVQIYFLYHPRRQIPYLGYYHNVNYGRASLAADLVEEFRAPIADRLTLNLINNRIFEQKDFYTNPKGAGVYLKREAQV